MSRFINPILHLIILFGILAVPIIAIILNTEVYNLSKTINYTLASMVNFGLYYLIFTIAVPKFLMRGKTAIFYSGTAVLIAMSALLKYGVLHLIKEHLTGQIFTVSLDSNKWNQLIIMAFISFSFAILAVFLRLSVEWFKNKQELMKMDLELKKAELAMLKYQMYPHFLFNTLNNIYALSKKSDPRASESMAKLSDILRYLLYQSDEGIVRLEEDLETLKSFIDLELLRKDDEGFLSWEQEGTHENHNIPPMLLLPLVENAFKHGAGQKMPVIKILCKIDEQSLEFTVINTKAQTPSPKIEASGIGLINVQKRLNLIYPNNSGLTIENGAKEFSASIKITF